MKILEIFRIIRESLLPYYDYNDDMSITSVINGSKENPDEVFFFIIEKDDEGKKYKKFKVSVEHYESK